MGFHTPVDHHFRFGELYGIRRSYSGMVESSELKKYENSFYNEMLSYLRENGSIEKIERFAKKNRALCEFAQKNAITEAYNYANSIFEGCRIPKTIKLRAKQKIKMSVSDKAVSIKTNEYSLPTFNKPIEEPTIYESEEFDTGEETSEKIDQLIKNVALEKGFAGGSDIIQSEKDKEFERDLNSKEEIKHNYSIQSIVIEAIAGNERKTQLIPPSTLYKTDGLNERKYINSSISSVLDGINAICGINFSETDYTWMSTGRPVPHIKAEIAVNSELVKGNRLLNAYFGPAGEFKDYLYKADGTPRIEASKSLSMNDIDREVNVVQSYPIIKAYAIVISWDNINGSEALREINDSDFFETDVKIIH